jgi:hypothetical protein
MIKLLTGFAFKFSLRPYSTAPYEFAAFAEAGCLADCGLEAKVWRCRLTP